MIAGLPPMLNFTVLTLIFFIEAVLVLFAPLINLAMLVNFYGLMIREESASIPSIKSIRLSLSIWSRACLLVMTSPMYSQMMVPLGMLASTLTSYPLF